MAGRAPEPAEHPTPEAPLQSPRRRLLVLGVALGLQALALLVCWVPLRSFDAHTRAIARAVVREPRPGVGALVPDAVGMSTAAAIVLVASLVSWALTWVIVRRRLVPATERMARWRLLIPLVAAELAFAVAMSFAPAVVRSGQYASVIVALPSAGVLIATMVGASVALAFVLATPGADRTARRVAERPVATGPSSTALRVAPWALAVVAVALIALLVVPIAADRPIADDYRYFANIRGTDLGSFLGFHLRTETGRYTQGALMWLGFQVLGPLAVQVVPWLLIAALAGALLAALRVFAPQRLRTWTLAVPLAVTGALLAVLAVPSVPDSLLWLSSSTVYIPGVIGWILAITCLALAWRRQGWRRGIWVAAAAVAAFLAQGCYEAMSAIGALLAVGGLVVAVRSPSPRAARVMSAGVVLAAALAGLAIIGLAPSVQTRAATTAAGNVLIGSFGAVYTDLELWHGFGAGQWLIAVGVGLVVSVGLTGAARRTRLTLGWLGAAVLTFVPLLCGAVSFLGLGWAPVRTYTVPALAFALGFAMLLGATVSPLWSQVASSRRAAVALLPTAAMVGALAVGAALVVPDLLRLSQAVSLRAAAVDLREASVVDQVAAQRDPIVVTPAPLLYYPAEARDFEFHAKQPQNWFWVGYKRYFGISTATGLQYVTQQPAGYCVDDPRVSNPVLLTCVERSAR